MTNILRSKLWSAKPAIKVGILHSMTGTMSISARGVAEATLMAIREINKNGGLLGQEIKAVVADGRSNVECFSQCAKDLIEKEKVDVIFGCWASNGRKAVKAVVEKYNHLLIYPAPYEGLESSHNIVYMGAVPNQQIIPTIKWAFDRLGKKYFIVGSDNPFSHIVSAIIQDQLKILGAEVVGDEYIPLASNEVSSIARKISDAHPEVIINTINGDTNIHFFRALRDSGIHSNKIPTISFTIAEHEIQAINPSYVSGDYAAWCYFQRLPNTLNKKFIENYKKHHGENRVTSDPIEAGYVSVYLWAQAVEEAQSTNTAKVLQSIRGQSCVAPEGWVHVDPDNLHTGKKVRIGQIQADGQFDLVWSSEQAIIPIPYPQYRTKVEWEQFLEKLQN